MDLALLCKSTIPLVAEVATFIKDQVGQVKSEEIEDKDHNSLVSYVDKTAEEMLVKGLTQLLPEATFITEEGTIENQVSDLQWVIDPLDGTTNFLHGVPVFSVSVGLVQKNRSIMGVVHEVNRDECFYAWKGGGAYLNGKPINVKPTEKLADSLMATGFPGRKFDLLQKYLVTFEHLVQVTRGMRRLGSAAVDLAYVAAGRFEGYFEYGLNAWDIAGGLIIVEEAGGKITDFQGRPDTVLQDGHLVASNGMIHEALIEAIQDGLGKA